MSLLQASVPCKESFSSAFGVLVTLGVGELLLRSLAYAIVSENRLRSASNGAAAGYSSGGPYRSKDGQYY